MYSILIGAALLQVLLPQLVLSLLERGQRAELESLAAQYARASEIGKNEGEERDDRRVRVAVSVRARVEWQHRLLHHMEDLNKGICTALRLRVMYDYRRNFTCKLYMQLELFHSEAAYSMLLILLDKFNIQHTVSDSSVSLKNLYNWSRLR